jgi:hypothetical protein
VAGETPIRLRVHPVAARKKLPARRDDWPTCAFVFHAALDTEGAMTLCDTLELVSEWPVREAFAFPGPEAGQELLQFVRLHRANTIAGARRRIEVIPRQLQRIDGRADGLGYRLRDRGFRKGWAVVSADAARQFIGIVDHWSHSRSRPDAWSLVLPGLSRLTGNGDPGRPVPFGDAPRVIVTPVGTDHLLAWGSTRRKDEEPGGPDEQRHRPPPKRGPILDVLQAARALRGDPGIVTLAAACAAFGVTAPSQEGSRVDCTRAEVFAISRLYVAEAHFSRQLGLGLDLSALVSTGGVGTALLREVGVAP